jgi:Ca-activated chloride channel family protein
MDNTMGIKKWNNGVLGKTNYEYRSKRDFIIRHSLLVFFASVLMFGFSAPAHSKDFEFMNLWMAPDQQGRYYFENGNYDEAAKRFKDPLWKGVSYYSNENFEAAIGEFAKVNSPEGYFNLANAYAHSKNYEEAVQNYKISIRLKPDYKEALANLELIQSLIEKKKKEEDEQEQQGDPSFEADEIKFDEKGKKGKKGEIEQSMFTEEQIAEMWMRNIRTSPADFLRMKFAIQTGNGEREKE